MPSTTIGGQGETEGGFPFSLPLAPRGGIKGGVCVAARHPRFPSSFVAGGRPRPAAITPPMKGGDEGVPASREYTVRSPLRSRPDGTKRLDRQFPPGSDRNLTYVT